MHIDSFIVPNGHKTSTVPCTLPVTGSKVCSITTTMHPYEDDVLSRYLATVWLTFKQRGTFHFADFIFTNLQEEQLVVSDYK